MNMLTIVKYICVCLRMVYTRQMAISDGHVQSNPCILYVVYDSGMRIQNTAYLDTVRTTN